MKRSKNILIIISLIILFSSCGVSTKNKRRTVAVVECYEKKLFDFRKKYEKREKDIERKNKKFLRKYDKIRKQH